MRRNQMLKWTPAERAIYDAVQVVELAGAHPLLTDAVTLLGQAQRKVADFIDSAVGHVCEKGGNANYDQNYLVMGPCPACRAEEAEGA